MSKKVLTDIDGNITITLPGSKQDLKFRPAKGRDLIRIERLITSLQDATGYVSNVEAMVNVAALLCVNEGVTTDTLLDLDPVDTMEVVKAVSNFPFIAAMQGK